jgi:hypothetical protein
MINWDTKEFSNEEWRGTVKNGNVEIRKTFTKLSNFAQMLIVADINENVTVSMNGKASMTVQDVLEIANVVVEAQTRIALVGE